jgi:hypothetical protein
VLRRSPLFVVLIALLVACQGSSTPRTPEETCRAVCATRVSACDRDGCERGCNFVLDRLIENQLDPILACMSGGGSCEDKAWARCSVRVGPHADGGPPAPPPPPEDD